MATNIDKLPEKATDRDEEIAQFLQRMKLKQELINGTCDEATINEIGSSNCPILWYVAKDRRECFYSNINIFSDISDCILLFNNFS